MTHPLVYEQIEPWIAREHPAIDEPEGCANRLHIPLMLGVSPDEQARRLERKRIARIKSLAYCLALRTPHRPGGIGVFAAGAFTMHLPVHREPPHTSPTRPVAWRSKQSAHAGFPDSSHTSSLRALQNGHSSVTKANQIWANIRLIFATTNPINQCSFPRILRYSVRGARTPVRSSES